MKKLDETIKGLEQYLDAGWTGINDYYRPFVADALELLKAQEPRLMTLGDVLKLRFQDVVYLEMSVTKVAIPAIVIDVIEHMPNGEIGLIQFRHIQEPTNKADLEYYGKTWRCWTSKPNQAEMEARPWNS